MVNSCAHCSRVGATASCAACFKAPHDDGVQLVSTFYCNADCQKAAWPTHKDECKTLRNRQPLFRAGLFLQELWYLSREILHEGGIREVEDKDGVLCLHMESSLSPESGGYKFYKAFPHHLFNNNANDKQTALAAFSCSQVFYALPEVIAWLLKDICNEINEVHFTLQNVKRKCWQFSVPGLPPTRNSTHIVLQIRLPSGKLHALDISGAQYGWYEPVVPWNVYEKRVKDPWSYNLGEHREFIAPAWTEDNRVDAQAASILHMRQVGRLYAEAMQNVIIGKFTTAQDFLTLPEMSFRAKQQELFVCASTAFHTIKDHVNTHFLYMLTRGKAIDYVAWDLIRQYETEHGKNESVPRDRVLILARPRAEAVLDGYSESAYHELERKIEAKSRFNVVYYIRRS